MAQWLIIHERHKHGLDCCGEKHLLTSVSPLIGKESLVGGDGTQRSVCRPTAVARDKSQTNKLGTELLMNGHFLMKKKIADEPSMKVKLKSFIQIIWRYQLANSLLKEGKYNKAPS